MLLLPVSATSAQVVCTLGSGVSSYNAYADQRPTEDDWNVVVHTRGQCMATGKVVINQSEYA